MTDGSLIGAEHYQLAWLIYILAGLGFIFCCWQIIRHFKSKNLRRYLVVFLACGIFTPSWQTGDDSFIAPAILVGGFDFLDGLDKGLAFAIQLSMKSLMPMVLLILISACVYLAINIFDKKKPINKHTE